MYCIFESEFLDKTLIVQHTCVCNEAAKGYG